MIEVVDVGNRLFVERHKRKGSASPKPIRIPRPGQVTERKRMSTPEEVRAFFRRTRRRKPNTDA